MLRYESRQGSVRSFCELEGISTVSFYNRRRRLAGEDQRFVPLCLRREEVSLRVVLRLEHRAVEVSLPADWVEARMGRLFKTLV